MKWCKITKTTTDGTELYAWLVQETIDRYRSYGWVVDELTEDPKA